VEADWESNAPELLVDKEGPEGVRAPKEWGPEGGLSPSPEGGGDQNTVSVDEDNNITQEAPPDLGEVLPQVRSKPWVYAPGFKSSSYNSQLQTMLLCFTK